MRSVVYFLAFLLSSYSYGQGRLIRGKVLDANTRVPISGVLVEGNEETLNAITNYEGLFELSIQNANEVLNFSHLSYIESVVEIPSGDNFTVLLGQDKTQLGLVDLVEIQNNDFSNVLLTFPTKYFARHAEPLGGWRGFYEKLSIFYTNRPDSVKNVHVEITFSINDDGAISKLDIVDLAQEKENLEWVKQAFESVQVWRSAKQHNFLTVEHFLLRLSDTNEVFTIVEDPPNYEGGIAAFYAYVQKNITYPSLAQSMGIEGKVFVQFVIDKNGSVIEPQILRGIGGGCDEEALRVISSSPAWNPGVQRGKPVNVRMILPITFKLDEANLEAEGKRGATATLDLAGGFMNNVSTAGESPEYFPAKFPGGQAKFTKFIKKNLVSPSDSIPINSWNNGVTVAFEINEIGRLANFQIDQGLGPIFDNEALRVAQLMPNWSPAKENDKPVASKSYVSIHFDGSSIKNQREAASSFEAGIYSFENDDPFTAMKHFNKAIELEPENLQYYLSRSALMIELEQFEGACRDLNLIKEGHPDSKLLFENYCQGN